MKYSSQLTFDKMLSSRSPYCKFSAYFVFKTSISQNPKQQNQQNEIFKIC